MLRGPSQAARPTVVAEALPRLEDLVLRRGRERAQRGELAQERRVPLADGLDARLLEHHLRDPDAVRVALAAPREDAAVMVVVREERRAQPGEVARGPRGRPRVARARGLTSPRARSSRRAPLRRHDEEGSAGGLRRRGLRLRLLCDVLRDDQRSGIEQWPSLQSSSPWAEGSGVGAGAAAGAGVGRATATTPALVAAGTTKGGGTRRAAGFGAVASADDGSDVGAAVTNGGGARRAGAAVAAATGALGIDRDTSSTPSLDEPETGFAAGAVATGAAATRADVADDSRAAAGVATRLEVTPPASDETTRDESTRVVGTPHDEGALAAGGAEHVAHGAVRPRPDEH